MKSKITTILTWLSRIVAAGILLQTLFFKFTAHPDSVLIFSSLGVEPWGRVTLGIVELIVAIAILIPKTSVKGSLASVGIMIGAIASHIIALGVEFNNDGGALFTLAIVVLIASSVNIILTKKLHHKFKK